MPTSCEAHRQETHRPLVARELFAFLFHQQALDEMVAKAVIRFLDAG
jgi:hypothetical protein